MCFSFGGWGRGVGLTFFLILNVPVTQISSDIKRKEERRNPIAHLGQWCKRPFAVMHASSALEFFQWFSSAFFCLEKINKNDQQRSAMTSKHFDLNQGPILTLKTNFLPESHPFSKERHHPNLHFVGNSMLVFGGVVKWNKVKRTKCFGNGPTNTQDGK